MKRRIYPYMAEYLARIFSKYSYTVLTALESCFAISGYLKPDMR